MIIMIMVECIELFLSVSVTLHVIKVDPYLRDVQLISVQFSFIIEISYLQFNMQKLNNSTLHKLTKLKLTQFYIN